MCDAASDFVIEIKAIVSLAVVILKALIFYCNNEKDGGLVEIA